jgi:hypothetical protein
MSSRFFYGFGTELLKLAAGQEVKPLAKQQMGKMPGLQPEEKQDPSPIASANRNTVISTPAGQPELPRGKPASTQMAQQQQSGQSKSQQFKATI